MLVFFKCPESGEIVLSMKKACPCCGAPEGALTANTTDAAKEKHVPDVKVSSGEVYVQVGSVAHPMLEAHYITFIALETEDGAYVKYLKPGEKPEALFKTDSKPVAVYEYCNLHGLWKKDL